MAFKLNTVAGRDRLAPRRDPYWQQITRGCHVGYRKMPGSDGPGSWSARALDSGTGKRAFKTLGEFENLPAHARFDAAVGEARKWFDHLGRGGDSTAAATVRLACQRYVEHLKVTRRGTERTRQKREAPKGEIETYVPAADDAEKRLKRYVLAYPWLADMALIDLKPQHLSRWKTLLAATPKKGSPTRSGARSNATLNRDATCLRAVLNNAYRDGLITTDFAWKVQLVPLKGADGRRELCLDRKQRDKLIASAAPDIANFLRGLSSLPLRPGALAGAKVADFDKRHGVLKIGVDKAGKDRKLKLPPATATFIGALVKDKLPTAPLFSRANGSAWNKDAWKWPIKAAAEAAGLPASVSAYTLRHSVITDLVVGGLDLLTVAQISGTSVAMIERHYGHLRQDHAAAALARLA